MPISATVPLAIRAEEAEEEEEAEEVVVLVVVAAAAAKEVVDEEEEVKVAAGKETPLPRALAYAPSLRWQNASH